MRALSILVVAVLAAGCAGGASRPPLRTGFEDIPVPPGLAYHAVETTVIESPSVKAGHLVYRGRVEPDSLRLAMRQTLEARGWRHLSTSTTSSHGTILAFEKGVNALQVHIYEGRWFTYLVLDASRPLPPAEAAATGGLSREPGAPPPAPAAAPEPAPRGAWQSARDGAVSVGRSVQNFFTRLFSN
jgi:hypothetical protein